ncbi:MAG: hypothetical protein LLG97_03275 [Deltaproteobacteria bacterium]|nr:hypothetical protein [Deltaproteobacteria bacterium]
MLKPKRYPALLWLCILVSILPMGCAHVTQTPPSKELGSIALVQGHFAPEMTLDRPAKGWLAGAGRGSANWAGKVMAAPWTGGGWGGCSGQGCGLALAVILALTTAAATVGGVAGAVVGAVKAEPAGEVAYAESLIRTAVAELRVQDSLRDHVTREALKERRRNWAFLEGEGPALAGQKVSYRHLAERGFETVLEISVLRFGLIGPWEVNPPLRLEMDAQVRVVRTGEDNEIYSRTFRYAGGSKKHSEWCADDAQPLQSEFERCYGGLAVDIVSGLLSGPVPEAAAGSPD